MGRVGGEEREKKGVAWNQNLNNPLQSHQFERAEIGRLSLSNPSTLLYRQQCLGLLSLQLSQILT